MIQSVAGYNQNNYNSKPAYQPLRSKVAFSGNDNNQSYENPISRNTEKSLAVLGATALSLAAGAGAGFIAKYAKQARKFSWPIAAVAAIITGVLTIPSKLYNANVSSFTREKGMDVFSREKSAETGITENIDSGIKQGEESLDDSINKYLKYKTGQNGNGMVIINPNT